ncbi:MAG: ATP-binding protein, partial [Legionellaceae bacterium]
LHSPVAPHIQFGFIHNGFTNIVKDDQKWRIFSTDNKQTGARVILAERDDTRNELGKRIAQDDLYIMLLTFPLSGLLIWIIIGRGLDSLDRVAEEVANRAPSHLEPVNLQNVPQEIKPVIDELNNLFKRLQNGFEREKRFTADAAHELRTPLAAIKAQAQVALNSQHIDEKNAALQKLIASVNRSTHIVQQLLTMSKLVPEVPENTTFDTVDLARATRDILAMLAHAAIEKTVELEFKQETDAPFVSGNPTILGILIRNLVDNAIRYVKDQGSVLVRVYEENQQIVLEVSDNGPGIPKELHARVFERFYRVLGNKSTGSGLGLAIVQQICTMHHAHIKLSTPDLGTGLIVRVYFPRIE